MRIVLSGCFGADNLGDEAILLCEVRGFRSHCPGSTIAVASFSPDTHRALGLDAFCVRDREALGSAIAGADLVVVGGGELWHDHGGWSPAEFFAPEPSNIACYARPLLMAATLGVPSVLFSNGIGPLRNPRAQRMVSSLAALATHVSVRDEESAEALRAAGFTGSILVTADPAFALVPDAATVIAPRHAPLRIGVAPRVSPHAAHSDELLNTVARAANRLAARRDTEMILLSFQRASRIVSDDDDLAVRRIGEALPVSPGDVRTVTPSTPEEAVRWLGSCDVIVTMHLHAAIFAAVAGVPSVAISIDPGLESNARLLGLSDLSLQPESCTAEAIERTVEHALDSRELILTGLAARVDVARRLLDVGYEAALGAARSNASRAAAVQSPDRLSAQLAEYERAFNRLRSRLEEREESWRTFATRGLASKAPIEPLTRVPQRRDIQVLKARLQAAETALGRVRNSPWRRLLDRYGRFKYRHLLPIYRMLGLTPQGAAKRTPESHGNRAVGRVPPGVYDIVCFPIIDWDFRFQRPQQLLSRFAAAGHRVFYVAPWFARSGDEYAIQEKGARIYRVELRGPQRNLWTEALDEKDTDELFSSLNRLRADVTLGATMACVQQPFWWPLARKARERFGWPIVYDCMDHHAGFSMHTGATLQHERELLAGADLVVASSAPLQREALSHTDRVLLLRNGCDYEHFASARGVRGGRPVIGYYGAIADWFDSDLVVDLAERRPDWDFVLVGSTDLGDVSRLSKLANVRLTGEKPYAEIPEWLARFDVALLPFKRAPLTEATNPVKAYEILASGKPLVSVPLPEMIALAPLVRLASTPREFETEIMAALEPGDARLVEERRAFARANTWQRRFEEFAQAVPDAFPRASVVVVTTDNLEASRRCLDSLFARTEWPNREVIVVDNGSTDGTAEYLGDLARRRPDLLIIRNDRDLGLVPACNLGLARATGQYLVLLSDDAVVSRGWLSTLIRHLCASPEIGLIAPVTNETANGARVAVDYHRLEDMPAWAARFTCENDDRLHGVQTLAMSCVAMRRQTFQEIGMLDERVESEKCEDNDYSRRVRGRGYRLVCARDSYVHRPARSSVHARPS